MIEALKEVAFSGPKFTQDVIDGFALREYKTIVETLDENIASAVASVSDPHLKWHGVIAISPFEEFQSDLVTLSGTKKSDKSDMDISRSDVRKYICRFSYDGVIINKPLYLPVLGHDACERISGTRLFFMPVMTDAIVAGMYDHVFTKFYKAKLRTQDIVTLIKKNGFVQRVNLVFIKDIYKIRSFTNPLLKNMVTPLGLYPLARLGSKQAIEKYANGEHFEIWPDDEREHVDTEKYDVIESTGRQPQKIGKIIPDRHNIMIVIDKDASDYIKNIAYSIIYSFDIFPEIGKMVLNYLDTDNEIMAWKVLLGTMFSKERLSSEGILSSVDEHFDVLENYVDRVVHKMFLLMGLNINNIDDYFHDQLNRYEIYKADVLENKTTVMDKNLEVVYYMAYAIIEGFNRIMRDLDRQYRSSKNVGDGKIAEAAVFKALTAKHVRSKAIFKMNNSGSRILPAAPAISCNDNKLFTITTQQQLQARGVGVNQPHRNKGSKFPTSVRHLRGVDIIVGNIAKLQKDSPWPGFTRNPFSHTDALGRFIIPDDLKKSIEHTEEALSAVFVNEEEIEDELYSAMSVQELEDLSE